MRNFFQKMHEEFFGRSIDDRDFGRMRLESSPVLQKNGATLVQSSSRQYWFGTFVFPPTDTEVGVIFFVGSLKGPTDFQRSVYHSIESRWDELYERARIAGVPIVKEWSSDVTANAFFRLHGITIDDSMPVGSFALHFTSEPSIQTSCHELTITFEDWHVVTANVT